MVFHGEGKARSLQDVRECDIACAFAGSDCRKSGGATSADASGHTGPNLSCAPRDANCKRADSEGFFITFEGPDGSGKSTQMEFLSALLREAGFDVVEIREPGATPLGEVLRNILLDPTYAGMDARSELLLYEAARAELVTDVIKPALAAGKIVLSDRFCDSTCAYQGAGRGLDLQLIARLNDFATCGCTPNATFVLGQEQSRANTERARNRGALDRIEQEGADFHERVAAYFAHLPQIYPQRVHFVDTSCTPAASATRILELLCAHAQNLKIPKHLADAHLKSIAEGGEGKCRLAPHAAAAPSAQVACKSHVAGDSSPAASVQTGPQTAAGPSHAQPDVQCTKSQKAGE